MDDKSNEFQGKNINLLEGGLAGPSAQVQNENKVNPLNEVDQELKEIDHPDTLDETIYATLERDLVKIVHKIEQVMIPRTTADQTKSLKNCKQIVINRGLMGPTPIVFDFVYYTWYRRN